MNGAVIVAAGRGVRMGAGQNKVFLQLGGEPVIVRTVRTFWKSGLFAAIAVVTGREDMARMKELLDAADLPVTLCEGGADRQESVFRGLSALPENLELVAIHDGARPLVTKKIIEDTLESAWAAGSGVASVQVKDTIKRVSAEGVVIDTPDRASLRAMQTPQSFRFKEILAAHRAYADSERRATDDAQIMEWRGFPVRLTAGSEENLKLTTPEDIGTAEGILRRRGEIAEKAKGGAAMRVGHGYDVHKLVEGRKLILCGEEIPWEKGLLGHSDADVALHALMDAMLGAAALGDIGRHFPDTDPAYEGADSGKLLDRVVEMIHEHGFETENVDVTIIAQRPKLAPHIEAMRANVAAHLGIPLDHVNVKATTTEHLGFEGEGLGISAHAVCLLCEA